MSSRIRSCVFLFVISYSMQGRVWLRTRARYLMCLMQILFEGWLFRDIRQPKGISTTFLSRFTWGPAFDMLWIGWRQRNTTCFKVCSRSARGCYWVSFGCRRWTSSELAIYDTLWIHSDITNCLCRLEPAATKLYVLSCCCSIWLLRALEFHGGA